MMPIYFNVESHLWILYLFFVNGALIHRVIRARSMHYSELTESIEASVLAAFFISIGLNGVLMLVLDLVDIGFSIMLPLLIMMTFALLMLHVFGITIDRVAAVTAVNYSWGRLALYLIVFIILFYNGGLIELSADSWWHMSLANQIAVENTFWLEQGHLNGQPSRYYPPLWHGNLAFVSQVSDASLPVLWNSFTAWGGVLKVMGFYLLALGLTKKSSLALISAALFVLLPGIGNSYLRVSAWPSHIAYAALFCLFYATFYYLDKYQIKERFSIKRFVMHPFSYLSVTISLLFLLLIILFTHLTELVWFLAGLTMYALVCVLIESLSKKTINGNRTSDLRNDWFFLIALISLLIVIAGSVYFMVTQWHRFDNEVDLLIAYFLPTTFFVFIVLLFLLGRSQWQPKGVLVVKLIVFVLLMLFVLSIDVRQFVSLFNPELAYDNQRHHEMALIATGLFGGELRVPGWHLQLRGGLLYSGFVAVILSVILAIVERSRATYFLLGNAVVAFMFCVSPYLYQWLQSVMNYHSPWRISLLIFHPIIFAMCIQRLWLVMVKKAS